jgi:hypothetical protein
LVGQNSLTVSAAKEMAAVLLQQNGGYFMPEIIVI